MILKNRNIQLWFKERFPVINFSTALLMAFFSKAAALLTLNKNWFWSPQDLGAFFVVASHLFLLRVFDEHKDHESDRINHPERVLQKGLVQLSEIRILGYFAFGVQIAGLFLLDIDRTMALLWGGVWFWTLLMFKEFFIKETLRANLVAYSFLHLLISPLLILFVFINYSENQINWPVVQIIFLVLFSSGWFYEITRKTKPQESERKEPSFSNTWGLQKASYIQFIVFNIFTTASLALFAKLTILNISSIVILTFLYILTVSTIFNFTKNPNIKNQKKTEGCVALSSGFVLLFPFIKSLLL